MDRFHFSTAECFLNCPARFRFRYMEDLNTIPTDDPANPLILGTAIHRGMESGEIQVQDPHLCANAISFAIFGITNTSSPAENMGREIQRVLETMLGLSFQEE